MLTVICLFTECKENLPTFPQQECNCGAGGMFLFVSSKVDICFGTNTPPSPLQQLGKNTEAVFWS